MPSDLDRAFSLSNLKLAWKWTLSNPEALYKNYCREVYAAYSVEELKLILLLRQKLLAGAYIPKPPCKLYFPKSSGILRPYSLLSVEDQIVYQAIINVIADKHYKRAKKRYLKQVFGHLYAGRGSNFFYRKWQDGYKSFSDSIRKAFADGYRYVASFDLTACYDTIDHQVLRQLLQRLSLDDDLIDTLLNYLPTWTQDSDLGGDALYHGHGIPQGPLPSGLLAELVLSTFDAEMSSNGDVQYFRYVDDIKLFAKGEHALRHALVDLDLVSKRIGLFPQSSKIEIHKIKKIEDEIKGVSHPPEPPAVKVAKDQSAVRQRLNELTRNYQVADETRFKWVLGMARPSKPLGRRLLRVLDDHPHLYVSIFRHFQLWNTIPDDIADALLTQLETQDLYAAFSARLLECVIGRISTPMLAKYQAVVENLAKNATSAQIGFSELRCAAVAWMLYYNKLTYQECLDSFSWCNWWCKTQILKHVNYALIGLPSASHLLTLLTTDDSIDVGVLAAYRLASSGMTLDTRVQGSRTPDAEVLLRTFGLIGRVTNRVCGISTSFRLMMWADPFYPRSWRTVLGPHYDVARQQIVAASGKLRTSPSEWVNLLDTFADLFLAALYNHDGSLGVYQQGNHGGVLTPTGRLAMNYPLLYKAISHIHDLRLESSLSHAYVKKTGKPTRRIKYAEVQLAAHELKLGLAEAARKW